MMANDTFGDVSDVFEAMIDWPKRLANERGFFRWLFDRIGATRVLDAACGTGHHAAMFNSWQLRVEGADLSPAMIDRCQKQFGQSSTLRWVVRGFDQPVEEPGSFDAAICIGNSLALAPDLATVSTAVGQMLAAVRSGGAVCVHVVNLWCLS
ncbi:MAG: class I SAM-dependent DNA methyltransferase, partial [Bacillota bacterium]